MNDEEITGVLESTSDSAEIDTLKERMAKLEDRIAVLESQTHSDHTISAEAVAKIAEQVKVRIAHDFLSIGGATIGVA